MQNYDAHPSTTRPARPLFGRRSREGGTACERKVSLFHPFASSAMSHLGHGIVNVDDFRAMLGQVFSLFREILSEAQE